MKVSKQWLQSFLLKKIATKKLAEHFTMAGLEVAGIEPVAGEFSDVICAKVLKTTKHPNADRLAVCEVDIGRKECVTIVCGAPNVRANLHVAVALVGAKLPGITIKKSKIRGVESNGMVCSAAELGLSQEGDSILELPDDTPVGKDFRTYMQLDDKVIDIELTPNRGDCASILGVAREAAAQHDCKLEFPKISRVKHKSDEKFSVVLSASSACPRYVSRIIRNIDQKNAVTPVWMSECLRRCGVSPISPVVDVTNYVMLLLGQPMHAFDLDKINGEIDVRFATDGEKLTLLDGKKIELKTDTLVIADKDNPLAIAGIMGGVGSCVDNKTFNVFLESAFFNPYDISGRARKYGVQTESSYRFERGVDYQLQSDAVELATKLLIDICGGDACITAEVCDEKKLPKREDIFLSKTKLDKVLGTEIEDAKVISILKSLYFRVKKSDEHKWRVEIPSHRFDIEKDVDLIEEIARLYGYSNIPDSYYHGRLYSEQEDEGFKDDQYSLDKKMRLLMRDRDYHEIITYSFVDKNEQLLITPDQQMMELVNPITTDMTVMRTSLWPGLLKAMKYNINHQQQRIRFFELGLRFIKINNELEQQHVIAGLIYGNALPEQWGCDVRKVDFYDIKTDVEALVKLVAQNHKVTFHATTNKALHPGRSAQITVNNTIVGFVGELHPSIIKELKIIAPVYLFELQADTLLYSGKMKYVSKYVPISKFPATRRDISILIKRDISALQIMKAVEQKCGNILTDITIFDVYEGENIQIDEKSVALGLTLQHYSRTLKEEDVNDILDDVLASLRDKFGAKLRD